MLVVLPADGLFLAGSIVFDVGSEHTHLFVQAIVEVKVIEFT